MHRTLCSVLYSALVPKTCTASSYLRPRRTFRSPESLFVASKKFVTSTTKRTISYFAVVPLAVSRRMASSIPGPAPALCDFDANLLHKDLRSDISGHIQRASERANVQIFVVPGSTLSDSAEAIALAQSPDYRPVSIIATAGVHPYHTNSLEHDGVGVETLTQIIVDAGSACSAVGECGLDYSEGFPEKQFQLPWMRSQVRLALERRLPLFFHERAAHEDFISVLREFGFDDSGPPPVPCCVHCFTGTPEELKVYVKMGFYIGLTGSVINLYKKDDPPSTVLTALDSGAGAGAEAATEAAVLKSSETSAYPEFQALLKIIPEDRLVIETDAPYMGFPGCRQGEEKNKKLQKTRRYPNVPSALGAICEFIAEASQTPYAHVAACTTANALRFFSRPALGEGKVSE